MKIGNATATFQQKDLPVAGAIDDNKTSAWAVDPEVGKRQAASFELETPIAGAKGTTLTFILKFENNAGHNLGRVRLAVSTAQRPVGPDGDEAIELSVEETNQALSTPPQDRTEATLAILAQWHKTHDADWQKLHTAVEDHLKLVPKPKLTKVLIASEGVPAIRLHTQGADFFEKTFFLKRGDLNQKVGEAPQGFLRVLVNAPDGEKHWQTAPPEGARTSYRRRALAEWITDTQCGAGHLLARVAVNRLWLHHFGRGLVATPSDFGAAGQPPTHPELLDYLAEQLIAGGWRLKDLHKLIMTSSAYMQSTLSDPERAEADPENRLLWRQSRRRLEAEAIRDAMLAASGELDERMFGPGTLDEAQRRRSIYFTIKRSQLVPSMMLFDAPDSLQGLGQRAATIVAPQALAILNNKQIHGYAARFAKRLLASDSVTDEQAIRSAYLTALAREVDSDELNLSLGFLRQAAASYEAAGKNNARELALADFCQVLFGLNEFIYID